MLVLWFLVILVALPALIGILVGRGYLSFAGHIFRGKFQAGAPIVYRVVETSTCPGPDARDIHPAERGELYYYLTNKYWRVEEVRQDGWIVAHLDEGGKPGKVIGNTAVKKGESNNVVIKLSEDVPAGGKLWPMLHIDAGTIGTYEFPGADAPVIVDGNIIMKQITVTAPAAAPAPAKLPTTGGEDAPLGLLLAAFALLLAGALLVLRPRHRA